MSELMSETANRNKYPEGTSEWDRDEVEHYRCDRHQKPTYYLRNADIVVHTDETECY